MERIDADRFFAMVCSGDRARNGDDCAFDMLKYTTPFGTCGRGFLFRVVTSLFFEISKKMEASYYEFEENDPEHQWRGPHVHL